MSLNLFILRRLDDVIHFFTIGSAYKRPRKNHEPLTIEEMKSKIQDALDKKLDLVGFIPQDELCWIRPHPIMGFSVLKTQLSVKYAPYYLSVSLFVAFQMPVNVDEALNKILNVKTKDRIKYTGQLLHRVYIDPERPKKKMKFPISFSLFNTDFKESTLDQICDTAEQYALPFFEKVKNVNDIKVLHRLLGVTVDKLVVLLVSLSDTQAALKLIDNSLLAPKDYSEELKTRLECLRTNIETGELQKALSAHLLL